MARKERSAGVVIYRIDPRLGAPLFLLLDYGRHWDYAKGHLHKGEDDLAAALRELREETGITDARIVPGFSHLIAYAFRHTRHGLVRKTVIFFLAETHADQVILSDEHVGFAFLPFEEAMRRLTFENAREVLQRAWDHLRHQS